ncbi:MAG: diguanylate cyclase [Eubacteriales bacterium]|nr:diguanylate cyclase [Eubacteriales bacterium]
MNGGKKRFYVMVCIGGVLLSLTITYLYACSGMKNKRNEILYIGETYSARLESLLDSLFHKTDIFEAVIITNDGEMPEEIFDHLSQSILAENSGIRAIQCLPDGTVAYCYPIEGNEKAIGGNVFKNEKRRADALLAKETHEITLSGPYSLTQGGFGIVARNPVYLMSEEGEESFWGFSVIVLELPEALDSLLFQEIERNGFQYRLTTIVEGERIVISSTADYQERKSVVENINVPNHTWQLELSPRKSWYDIAGFAWILAVSLGITVLVTMLVYVLEERNQNLKERADRDSLTGLINRRKLMDYIELRCGNTKMPLTLLYCDINDFKTINDTYGHAQGDVVLKEAARRMKEAFWKEDIVARVGGDEFIIVVERCAGMEGCDKCMAKIRTAMEKPFLLSQTEVFVSTSIGYAFFPEEAQDVQELIRLGDERMYEEKRSRKRKAADR